MLTAQSFLNYLSFGQKLTVLLISPLAIFLPIFLLNCLILLVFKPFLKNKTSAQNFLISVLPSLILSFLAIQLLENFTYTLFKFSVLRIINDARIFYGLLIIFCFVSITKFATELSMKAKPSKILDKICFASLLTSLILFVFNFSLNRSFISEPINLPSDKNLPNIYIIGSDALRADFMQVYGYEVANTPFLNSIKSELIIAENAFSNANKTYGSTLALLTGKLGIKTNLAAYPQILQKENSFQHLPGILKQLGYKSMQLSARKNADSFDANMRLGFDFVNYRETKNYQLPFISDNSNELYFLIQIFERIYIILMQSFALVSVEKIQYELAAYPIDKKSDSKTIQDAKEFISKQTAPHMVHLHLMGTHAGSFLNAGFEVSDIAQFSNPTEDQPAFNKTKYEQAILRFDNYLKDFFEFLKNENKFENSIIVIYSDHDPGYHVNVHVPLIFRFPHGQNSKTIKNNTQLIDIAPTILEFLGLQKPNWMDGDSLLFVEPHANRPILSVIESNPKEIGLSICDRAYIYSLQNKIFVSSKIPNQSPSCNQEFDLEKLGGIAELIERSNLAK